MSTFVYRLPGVRRFWETGRTVRLLLLSDFALNLGFFMLIPFLTGHLQALGVGAGMTGLVLGLRNLSQQGLFLIGGSLGDRIGYKPMMVSGCLIRAVGFLLFGLLTSLPGMITAAFLTGFASALFTPAMKAYTAYEAKNKRSEVFSLSGISSQIGALAGPLIGMVLLRFGFHVAAYTSALVFFLWALWLIQTLPDRRGTQEGCGETPDDWKQGWRKAFMNRPFILFSLALSGYAVLFNQLYLCLPLEMSRRTGSDSGAGILFFLSSFLVILGQTQVSSFCKARWRLPSAISLGLCVMGLSFLPLIVLPRFPALNPVWNQIPILLATALLTLGMMISFPFVMEMIPILGKERHLGVHYGLFYLIWGLGGAVGNLAGGSLFDFSPAHHLEGLPWVMMILVGILSAASIAVLDWRGLLPVPASPDSDR